MLLSRRSTAAQALALLAWLAIVFVAAALGALATSNAPSFYGQLAKPTWAPPAAVFGPVWSVLYLLMAVAAWLVWREKGAAGRSMASGLFFAQLGANALWSWLFFAWHHGAFAFAEVLLLWALVVATAAAFWRVHRTAGALLLPYVAWVSFASALTWAIWQRNPQLL